MNNRVDVQFIGLVKRRGWGRIVAEIQLASWMTCTIQKFAVENGVQNLGAPSPGMDPRSRGG